MSPPIPSGERSKKEQPPKGKQVNPFSEQEKHGEAAQGRKPQTDQESHGGSVQQRATTGEDDTVG